MAKLALFGGTPVRAELFPSQNTIGPLEIEAANRVLASGKLTGYQGNGGENFRGGVKVRALEEEWAAKFGVRHAIACNSATSGLFIACGAAGMDRADAGDVVVTPFSMSCSASVPLGWKHGVRFGDIERDYYCLSAESVGKHVLNTFQKYSAVIPVSLFGQPYDCEAINAVAKEKGVYVIEDAAQALGSMWYDKQDVGHYAGTLGDIGVYSFNLGKHLTCGEGGMIVTDNDELAMRCRLIMNHAEAVVHDLAKSPWVDVKSSAGLPLCTSIPTENFKTVYGFNLRMTEICAAIVRVQLARMDAMIQQRVDNVTHIINRLKHIPCLGMPAVRPGCTHTYYVLPLKYDPLLGWKEGQGIAETSPMPISRDLFVDAVRAELKPTKDRESEGVTVGGGYCRPIQNMPLFDRSLDETPECQRQWADELIIVHRMFGPNASRRDLDDICNAFEKVWDYREELMTAK
jgi:dTDP-4-amino-4,6-dideoxygalactose transaminase